MAFDKAWEEIFRSRSWGRYPSENVVRFVAQRFFAVPDRGRVRILDLGCGAGSNTWFMAREGFSVTAIDGSEAAIGQTKGLLAKEGLEADLLVGDFTKLAFPSDWFDAVVDCCAVQHNSWNDIIRIHNQIHRVLKPDGWFYGEMLSVDSSHAQASESDEQNTFLDFKAGCNKVGVLVHLFTRQDIDMLFSKYLEVNTETLARTEMDGSTKLVHFRISARKADS